jgi:hypothetical protein
MENLMLLRALVLLLHPFLGKQQKYKVWVALQSIFVEMIAGVFMYSCHLKSTVKDFLHKSSTN